MALSEIALTSGMRNNLLALQKTANQLATVQQRLSTGKKINTALDDPTAFFAAEAAYNRSSDLADRKANMDEAIQAIKAASNGITSITALINSAKALASSAQATSDTLAQLTYESQFLQLTSQITTLASDSSYRGTNLLTDGTLTVEFGQKTGDASLTVNGFKGDSASLGVTGTAGWSTAANITQALNNMDKALTKLRSSSSILSSNLATISARKEFTDNMINTLTEGANNLTLADMNEAGAQMLTLQTKQSLGTTALSLSSQAAQSVLRLF